jgi:hypothetical protein
MGFTSLCIQMRVVNKYWLGAGAPRGHPSNCFINTIHPGDAWEWIILTSPASGAFHVGSGLVALFGLLAAPRYGDLV